MLEEVDDLALAQPPQRRGLGAVEVGAPQLLGGGALAGVDEVEQATVLVDGVGDEALELVLAAPEHGPVVVLDDREHELVDQHERLVAAGLDDAGVEGRRRTL